jgi:hypothetical protein
MIDVGKETSQKGNKKERTNGRETTEINKVRKKYKIQITPLILPHPVSMFTTSRESST